MQYRQNHETVMDILSLKDDALLRLEKGIIELFNSINKNKNPLLRTCYELMIPGSLVMYLDIKKFFDDKKNSDLKRAFEHTVHYKIWLIRVATGIYFILLALLASIIILFVSLMQLPNQISGGENFAIGFFLLLIILIIIFFPALSFFSRIAIDTIKLTDSFWNRYYLLIEEEKVIASNPISKGKAINKFEEEKVGVYINTTNTINTATAARDDMTVEEIRQAVIDNQVQLAEGTGFSYEPTPIDVNSYSGSNQIPASDTSSNNPKLLDDNDNDNDNETYGSNY